MANLFSYLISYCLTCWLMFPFTIVFIKFILFKLDRLIPEFELDLDYFLSKWKFAPVLFPIVLAAIFSSLFKHK